MQKTKSYELVLTALFAAIIVIMAFTPLGYIPLVVINATIIHIPVVLGAIFCGPGKGAFLGFIFGLTSFIKNTIAATSLSAFVFSPILASSVIGPSGVLKSTIICFVPRILVGVIPYYVYKAVVKLVSGKHKEAAKRVCNLLISILLLVSAHAFLQRILDGRMSMKDAGVTGWIAGAVIAAGYFGITEFALKKKEGPFLGYVYAAIMGAMTNTLLVMPMIYIFYRDAYAKALSVNPDAVLGVIAGIITFNGIIEAVVAAVLVAALGMVLHRIHRR